MIMHRRLPHLVDAMCMSLAATNINAECPSGNVRIVPQTASSGGAMEKDRNEGKREAKGEV